MKLRFHSGLLLGLCLALIGRLAVGQGQLYRWVDDDGVVHYGDHVPPQYASRNRDLLNTQGVTVGSEIGALTNEERAEIARIAAIDEQARQEYGRRSISGRSGQSRPNRSADSGRPRQDAVVDAASAREPMDRVRRRDAGVQAPMAKPVR